MCGPNGRSTISWTLAICRSDRALRMRAGLINRIEWIIMNFRKSTSNPSAVAAPIRGYYSNAVKLMSGPLLFVSGQLGLGPDGRLAGDGDVAAEAEQALRNIELILRAHGARMDDLVKVTVYVTSIDYLDAIEPVRTRYFALHGPASVIVEVSALALGAKVEIEAIAAVD